MAKKRMTFGHRQNAKRAAERAIAAGSAPSIDYGIKEHQSGRFEIVWHRKGGTEEVTTTEQAKGEIATAADGAEGRPLTLAEFAETPEAQANKATWDDMLTKAEVEGWPDTDPDSEEELEVEAEAPPEQHPEAPEDGPPDPFPKGTRVRAAIAGQIGRKKFNPGTVEERVSGSQWRVLIDGEPSPGIYTCGQLSLPEAEPATPAQPDLPGPAPRAKPERKLRTAASPSGKTSKATELDTAAARGEMPTKPIMTSKANPGYQARFDKLEAWAKAGDWDAVRGYEVKGINSYAKMVKQYRDRLLTAHAAAMQQVAA